MPRNVDESPEIATEEPEERHETRARRRENAPEVPRAGVFGSVPVDATHWRVKRIGLNGAWEPLTHPLPDGTLAVSEWPITELTPDTLRDRWGAGTFQIVWYGPGENGRLRHITQSGTIKVLPPAVVAPVAAPAAPAARDGFGEVERALVMMQSLSQLTSTLVRPPQAAPESEELRRVVGELAEMRARLEAEAAQRIVEERHRAELAERDRRIAQLERRLDDAEREEPGDEPMFRPGDGSLWEQIGYGILNAAAKKPEIVAALATPILERMSGAQAQQQPAAPTTPPRPRAMPAPPPPAPPPHAPPPLDGTANAMPSVPIVPVVSANGQPKSPARPPSPPAPPPESTPAS
jgi:hypothetical protein